MSIRGTLAPLFQSAGDEGTLEAAFTIAKRFGSHVDALFAQPDPTDTIPLFGEDTSPDTIRRLRETAIAAAEQQRLATRKAFDRACKTASIPLVNRPGVAAGQPSLAWTAGQPSAAWTDIIGRSDVVVARKALLSDLVVFGRNGVDAAPAVRPALEAVLLKSRRPILLVPTKTSEHIGHNVAIAWNGTAEAASALASAMPFLEKAVAIHLITAATPRTVGDSADDAANYLAWHGIGSERRVIAVDDRPVGAVLMQEAVNIGADLLVMGGYGHHRLRERILGGVTRHVINHAGLPILMAH